MMSTLAASAAFTPALKQPLFLAWVDLPLLESLVAIGGGAPPGHEIAANNLYLAIGQVDTRGVSKKP
jgi:hypothetical protein